MSADGSKEDPFCPGPVKRISNPECKYADCSDPTCKNKRFETHLGYECDAKMCFALYCAACGRRNREHAVSKERKFMKEWLNKFSRPKGWKEKEVLAGRDPDALLK